MCPFQATNGRCCSRADPEGGGAGSRLVASSGERVSLEGGARERAREIIRKDAAGGTALCRRWLEAPTLPCDWSMPGGYTARFLPAGFGGFWRGGGGA